MFVYVSFFCFLLLCTGRCDEQIGEHRPFKLCGQWRMGTFRHENYPPGQAIYLLSGAIHGRHLLYHGEVSELDKIATWLHSVIMHWFFFLMTTD